MQIPGDLRYAENHEWARLEDDGTVRVGITDFAQDALGDVVYVDVPDVGTELGAGDVFGEIESTKSVSDVYAPVAGTVTASNEALAEQPDLINTDPYGEGWMIVITPADEADLSSLEDAATYASRTAGDDD